jgi:hypothetical protein
MTVSVTLFDEYSSKAVNGRDQASSSKAAFLALTVEFHRGYLPMTSIAPKPQRQKLAALAWEKFHQE